MHVCWASGRGRLHQRVAEPGQHARSSDCTEWKRHQGFQSTIPGLTSQIPPDWRKAHATALREYCGRTLPSAASGKNYVRRFPSQDKKRLQHALISDSDGRSLQGMLDGFEANGIKYYNKYATLKELMGRCWSAATTGSFIFWASGLRRLLGCEGICHHDRLDRWALWIWIRTRTHWSWCCRAWQDRHTIQLDDGPCLIASAHQSSGSESGRGCFGWKTLEKEG